jgi:uncharacterized membrane protein YjgN (DUF898 family)
MLDAIPAHAAGNAAMPAPEQVIHHRPQFSGRTGEYFGIWFVNLLLGILTLGIYSAWAKVRTERYFYSNTRLAGASFEYLADPIAVLKGRLIAYAVVIALALSSKFAIGLYFALFLAVMILMPWVIVMSLRFRARNSAWRGLTFRFDREGGAAYGPFMGWPILQAITASLLYPVMKQRQHDFVAGGHWFGRKRFDYAGDTGQYYVPYAIAAGCVIALFVALTVAMTGAVVATRSTGQPGAMPGAGILAIVAVFYLGFFAIAAFVRVRYGNLLWNSTRLGEHRFESTVRARDMIWIYATNLVAILCTLGLAVPWAMVRLARYRAEHFAVVSQGSLDDFVADADRQHGAAGAELVDALDVGADFGF